MKIQIEIGGQTSGRRDLPVSISSQCRGARGGQAPALRKKNASLHVGRGPVPRHAFGWQTASPL